MTINPPFSLQNPNSDNVARDGYPIGQSGRILLAAWSLVLLCGFGLAVWFEPDPNGYGTHQQLGLPPCTFRMLFGISCPSCGMTTSVAHFVRGQFVESLQANPAGFLLALMCLAQIPWSWCSLYQGALWKVGAPEKAALWLLGVFCGAAAVQWAVRLAL